MSITANNTSQVSVVIPVRNHPEQLEENLFSLTSQNFMLKDFEVLVCDDGSTDDMGPVVESFRGILKIQLLRQQPKGPAAARNLGIRMSIAPIIIFVDGDVVADQALVSQLVTSLDKNPEWVGAEAKIESIGRNKGPLWDAPACHNGGRYHTAAIAYRRKALGDVGGFDENFILPACEDVDLAARLLKLGKSGYVPEAIAYHPVRRVTLRTHWRWRRHWKYEMILAKRYGFLSFPGNPASPFPRLRVGLAAVVTLPAGRLIEGIKYVRYNPSDGVLACLYALFDVLCGVLALPDIIFSRVPPRKSYLSNQNEDTGQ